MGKLANAILKDLGNICIKMNWKLNKIHEKLDLKLVFSYVPNHFLCWFAKITKMCLSVADNMKHRYHKKNCYKKSFLRCATGNFDFSI